MNDRGTLMSTQHPSAVVKTFFSTLTTEKIGIHCEVVAIRKYESPFLHHTITVSPGSSTVLPKQSLAYNESVAAKFSGKFDTSNAI